MGPITKPIKNNKLSNLLFFSDNALAAIPLIPTNLPLNKKKITTARPIIIPPRVAVIGVKFTIFINYLKLEKLAPFLKNIFDIPSWCIYFQYT